jgi:hypothetical protein
MCNNRYLTGGTKQKFLQDNKQAVRRWVGEINGDLSAQRRETGGIAAASTPNTTSK